MKFSIFVFACLLASALSTPIGLEQLKEVLARRPMTAMTTTTTTPASTDAPTTIQIETTTVVKDDSTTAIVEVTTATAQQESTEAPTTVPSTSVPSSTTVPSTAPTSTVVPTTVVSLKSKVSTVETKAEPAPVVVENTKKSTESRKGRGSKKFNMVEKSEEKAEVKPVEKPVEKPTEEEKPKEEETPKEETPEKEPEEGHKDEKLEEKKPEAEEDKQPEQKPKESDDDENIPTVSGKIVPAVAQPRIPSPEARSKGRKYKDIQVIKLESELEENGKYHFNYENEDGTIVQQSGEMKEMDNDGEKMMGESVVGSYSYKDDDGNTISLTYTADENGFRPVGAHIPTIPPAIARSLAWQATAKPWVDPWVVEQEKLRKTRKIH